MSQYCCNSEKYTDTNSKTKANANYGAGNNNNGSSSMTTGRNTHAVTGMNTNIDPVLIK